MTDLIERALAERDAFARFRVSNPTTLFDSQSQYDVGALFWENKVANNATAAHRANEAAVRLSITTDTDSEAIRQSREYHHYQPGKSQFVVMTFCFGPPVSGALREVGYGDSKNGVFLREENGSVSMVLRSNVTGSVVETVVPEAEWNGETSIGPAVESLTMDWTKTQIFGIDLEWLGVGRVRTFFVVDGKIFYAHVFDHANVNSTVYMTTANLPVRYRIAGNDTAAGTAYMDCICAAVMSEGGYERQTGTPMTVSTGATLNAVSTREPVLSLRPALLFNSIENRIPALIQEIEVLAQANGILLELVYKGTLTGASFATVGANSALEYDVAATAISGGTVIQSSYIAAAASGGGVSAPSSRTLGSLGRLPLTLNIAGDTQDVISVVATGIGGTANIGAAINWQEIK